RHPGRARRQASRVGSRGTARTRAGLLRLPGEHGRARRLSGRLPRRFPPRLSRGLWHVAKSRGVRGAKPLGLNIEERFFRGRFRPGEHLAGLVAYVGERLVGTARFVVKEIELLRARGGGELRALPPIAVSP